MKRIAVLYDTTEGQTAKIACKMAELARDSGNDVTVMEVRKLPENFQLDAFDGVIIGGSIHVGKHSPALVEFVKQNRRMLEKGPSAFFSVSLSAAGKSERQQQNAERCLDEFLVETEWTPRMKATFAGALLYQDYGFFKRLMMKWIAKQEGGDTDTSRNYEYTTWSAVDEFAREFLRQVFDES